MKNEEAPGIAWIREIRHKISAEFDHDTKKLLDHYRELEKNTRIVWFGTSERSRIELKSPNDRRNKDERFQTFHFPFSIVHWYHGRHGNGHVNPANLSLLNKRLRLG